MGGDGYPFRWHPTGWGTNIHNFTYPFTGFDGFKAARADITSYPDSDVSIGGVAGWYTDDFVLPVPGALAVKLTLWYRTSVDSELAVVYQTPGGEVYQYLTTLPPALNWTQASVFFWTSPDATSMSLWHDIYAVGYLKTDQFDLGSTLICDQKTYGECDAEDGQFTAGACPTPSTNCCYACKGQFDQWGHCDGTLTCQLVTDIYDCGVNNDQRYIEQCDCSQQP